MVVVAALKVAPTFEMMLTFLVCHVLILDKVLSGSYISAETRQGVSLVNMNEKGVPITGRTSVTMQIKSCGEAIFILSEKHNFNRQNGRYFLVLLGASDKLNINGIRDSCVKACLKPSVKREARWLDCSNFRSFWARWDTHGALTFGEGAVIPRNVLMHLRSPNPFSINFLFLFGQKKHVEWRFLVDEPPQFVLPQPYGGSTISIPEDTDAKKVILYMKASDPDKDVLKFAVVGEFASLFHCEGSSLVLTGKLDYEARKMYSVTVQAFDGSRSVVTRLVVLVTDVNDNYPEVNKIDPIVIPEQLPVGTMIGVITSAHDVDTNDILSYRLTGLHHNFFTIDPRTGMISIRREIDLEIEKMNTGNLTADLMLEVTDAAGHLTHKPFDVVVTNINDNPPEFPRTNYELRIRENGTEDVNLLTFHLTDPDQDSRQNVTLTLTSDAHHAFYLVGHSLWVNSKELDYEDSFNEMHRHTVKVKAVDAEVQGRRNTATATVLLAILPVNEESPIWIWPVDGSMPTIKTSADVDSGHLVAAVSATDSDLGQDGHVDYQLVSVTNDLHQPDEGIFSVDGTTGLVTTASNSLQPGRYKLHIRATDSGSPPKHADGWLRVVVEGRKLAADFRAKQTTADKTSCNTIDHSREIVLLQCGLGVLGVLVLLTSSVIVCSRRPRRQVSQTRLQYFNHNASPSGSILTMRL